MKREMKREMIQTKEVKDRKPKKTIERKDPDLEENHQK
jgi:hypothetical protein